MLTPLVPVTQRSAIRLAGKNRQAQSTTTCVVPGKVGEEQRGPLSGVPSVPLKALFGPPDHGLRRTMSNRHAQLISIDVSRLPRLTLEPSKSHFEPLPLASGNKNTGVRLQCVSDRGTPESHGSHNNAVTGMTATRG
ncbi:hypothetical protein AAFF_G00006590 [Aldrovandia affinis]|uniref:Uncharacterized protein n=1 Tax=Aldrovandia affinis TaxID=143900 RepID=A0AAD7X3Y2_9TELE|nr:hypothetical protein AAFF_G00006590 [Aldrovandia affinis]